MQASVLSQPALDEIRRVLFGGPVATLPLPDDPPIREDIHTLAYAIDARPEQCRAARNVTVAAVQFEWPSATDAPIQVQRIEAQTRVKELVAAAGRAGAQVLCLQEAWPMPFAFCTREKEPWCEFAEGAGALIWVLQIGCSKECIRGEAFRVVTQCGALCLR
jgi:beta-ureidopropionase